MLTTRWFQVRSLSSLISPPRSQSPFRRILLPITINHVRHNTTATSSLYIDTNPPSSEQLYASEIFFRTHIPSKTWTATEWRQQPHSESKYMVPEVAFLGRSNSGKSSLLNGLLFDQNLCRVGAKPGKTVTMHAWSLSPVDAQTRGARRGYQGDMEPKLTVLDMPGYGHGSHAEWGAAIMKYLTARRQLRRAFVLINPLHGLKQQDLQMLELLRNHGIPHQVIACKMDQVKPSEAAGLLTDIQLRIDHYFAHKKQVRLLMIVKDILTIGGLAQTKIPSKRLDSTQGLPDVRWAMLRAAGLEDYAIALAANGGVPPPKVKQGRNIHDGQSNVIQHEHETQPTLTPQNNSSMDISIEDLMSDDFRPQSRSSDTQEFKPTGSFEVFDDRQSVPENSAKSFPPPRSRTQTVKSSRTKDIKRYGARKR